MNDDEMREWVDSLLARRQLEEIESLAAQRRHVAFYGCGEFFDSITKAWSRHLRRRIDFCCDRDESKWGRTFNGIRCISPRELKAVKDDCSVFISVGNSAPVFESLAREGFSSLHQIYEMDIEAAAFLADARPDEVADGLCSVFAGLSDARSKDVFMAVVARCLRAPARPQPMLPDDDQYFPRGVIQLSDHESLLDVGAFTGDTILDFTARVGSRFDSIFAFELAKDNFAILEQTVRGLPSSARIRTFNLGAWDSEADVRYSANTYHSVVGAGDASGHVVALDQVLSSERITFVKMDIEGAELHALRGASGIIREQKPTLAICVYHDFRHLWQIPLFIKSLVPEYRLSLRHHGPLAYETVCYATLQRSE